MYDPFLSEKKTNLLTQQLAMAELFFPPSWAASSNIYEVNLRQYTPEGTIDAFRKHLPRLADMGVGIIWLMPVTPISQKGKKGSLGSYYATQDYTRVNPEYGNEDDFRGLVEDCHRHGLKIIIDWVANHTGLDHVWTQSHPEFYLKDNKGNFTEKNGWDDVIDLDYSNPALQDEMISCMGFWLKTFGIDGFRCDMAHLVPLAFWKKARTVLDKDAPRFWLAECEVIAYHEVFDTSYTWEWMHVTERFAREDLTIQQLWDQLYKQDHAFPNSAFRAYFTSNHDENSWNGTEYEKYGGLALPLAVFSATWNGMPLVYGGQEIPNKKRLKFFDKDSLEWSGQPALHDFYKKLLRLHTAHPALKAGDESVITHRIYTSHPLQVFSFLQQTGPHKVWVLLNYSGSSFVVRPESTLVEGLMKELFTGEDKEMAEETAIKLPAYGYMVWYT